MEEYSVDKDINICGESGFNEKVSPEPRVSIIIPTYRRDSSFVKRAIDSALLQSYRNIEVIVVDDNGTEDTAVYRANIENLMHSYCDNRIMYKQNQNNLGGSLARNEGLRIATGDYVTFLDDDDRYLPGKVENQLKFMLKHELEMCFTDLRLCDPNERTVDFREYSRIQSYDHETLLRYHITRHITGTPTFMYRKEAIDRVGGFPDAKMGQEFYLMFKTIKSGVSIGYLPRSDVIAYRHQGEGLSMGSNKIDGEKALYSFKKKHFGLLSLRERLFVKFRHHVVLAVAYRRSRKILRMLAHGAIAIIVSPVDAVVEAIGFAEWLRKVAKLYDG